MKIFLLSLLLVLASCNKDDGSPDSALKAFVDEGLGRKVSRDDIQERTTGKLLAAFEAMTDEEFEKFANMQNIRPDSFKVLSKSCQDTKCIMTYSIGYTTKSEDKAIFASEVKKIAEVIQVDDKWLVSDVTNVKTYHESLEPLNTSPE